MAFEAYLQALDGISKFMAVSANRKAQAGFLCPVRAPPPYFGHFSNLTKNIGAFQMQSCTSTQIQTIQNQAQTVTIPRELANNAADACFYADRAAENLAAILDAAEILTDMAIEQHTFSLTVRKLIKAAKNEVETLAELHPFSLFETSANLNDEIFSQIHSQTRGAK